MKRIGLILIAVSFLIGAYITVLHEWTINWTLFIPVLILGLIGVGLVQVGQRKAAQHEDTIAENIKILEESLSNIVRDAKDLNARKSEIDVYDLHEFIDDTFINDLNKFVDARESIGHAYSLQDYADIMSHYAAGERYLNRVWSTSVDGYIDEAHTYLGKAEHQFTQALERLTALGNTPNN
ncbi:MAG: hypothetical protein K9N46_12825 [Candidatus Marinimicrobia bacterium]|nr:hypothetical protein [Candidatus Neomarinimicrobiota bacterium]MCF7827523.1 hypothetical protein [Candidatus Neomarinimicrobiota bacterium]MCF7881615.1 hypothetical protein [Candidatus Neomarinimicrobiota bacterium]